MIRAHEDQVRRHVFIQDTDTLQHKPLWLKGTPTLVDQVTCICYKGADTFVVIESLLHGQHQDEQQLHMDPEPNPGVVDDEKIPEQSLDDLVNMRNQHRQAQIGRYFEIPPARRG